jgi:hypothetical protein
MHLLSMHSFIYCCFLGCMHYTSCLGNCVGRVHPHETHFTSLFINTLSHHQKCLHDSLFNVHEIPTETGLSIKLHWHNYLSLGNCAMKLALRLVIPYTFGV